MADKSARATAGMTVRRAFPAQFEIRAKTGSTVGIQGYATVYAAPYEMFDQLGSYQEVVRSGAGRTTLGQRPQVQLLLNHGGMAMAYTKAGTLRLSEDTTGLQVDADVDTARTDVHDMVHALERGDVDEMSFAFRVTRQEWSPDYEQRDIIEYNLHRGDVSVVNFGANAGTEVGLREQDLALMNRSALRQLKDRLEHRLAIVVVDGEDDDDEDVACLKCGALNEDDAQFCDQCGAQLATPPQGQAGRGLTIPRISRQIPAGLALALAQAQG